LTFYNQDSYHVLDGPYKEFYANGKPKVVGTYKDGNLDSSWRSYHYNGKLMEKGVYRNNIKAGIWEEFNDVGKLTQRAVYDEKATNPFAPTKETTWNDAGLKIEEKYFANNRDEIIKCSEKNISENKLLHSLFDLDYVYKDGVTTLILVEFNNVLSRIYCIYSLYLRPLKH